MEDVSLVRQGSTVPVSCHQAESTVIPRPIGKAWEFFRDFKLEKLVPGKVASTNFISGAPGQLDSIVEINYTDGAKWQLRLTEVSELRHSVGY